MAFVIAVAQQKGGAGKSTLAANLAVALLEHGPVTLLDTDPQQSLARWHAIRGEGPLGFDAPAGWRVSRALDGLARQSGFVIMDTPPHVESDARVAIRAAQLVLIPLQPSLPDLWASEATIKLAEAEKRPWHYVLNRVPPQSRVRDVVMEELERRKAPVLAEPLGNRAAFSAAFATGQGVTEAAPRSAAAAEVRARLFPSAHRRPIVGACSTTWPTQFTSSSRHCGSAAWPSRSRRFGRPWPRSILKGDSP